MLVENSSTSIAPSPFGSANAINSSTYSSVNLDPKFIINYLNCGLGILPS
jgi:hypothetical protein